MGLKPWLLNKAFIFALLTVFDTGLGGHLFAQITDEVKSKLPFAEQARIQRAAELNKKAERTKETSKYLIPKSTSTDNANAEKKYLVQRTEASDQYKEAHKFELEVYTDNIKTYRKNATGDESRINDLNNVEKSASDTFKKAQDVRGQIKKQNRTALKISLMEQAEMLEEKAILMNQKILLAYLKWPEKVDYQLETEQSVSPKTISKDSVRLFKDSTKNANEPTTTSPQKVTTASTPVVNIASAYPPNVPYVTSSKDRKGSGTEAAIKEKNNTVITDSLKVKSEESTKSSISQKNTKAKYQTNDSSLYGKMKVDESQVDQFNTFLTKTYPNDYEHYIIDFNALNYGDMESLRQAWYAYLYGYKAVDSTYFQKSNKLATDSVRADTLLAVQPLAEKQPTEEKLNTTKTQIKSEQKINNQQATVTQFRKGTEGKKIPEPPKTTKETLNKDNVLSDKTLVKKTEDIQNKKAQVQSEKAILAKSENKKSVSVPMEPKLTNSVDIKKDTNLTNNDGFIFRVQVVCCRVKLDDKTLKSIYTGNESVIETFEDGWYKYTVGAFQSYREAKRFKKESEIPGAFVVSYLNGKRVKITPAIVFGSKYRATDYGSDIEFRIQVAAARIQLSDKFLVNIYNGPSQIMMINENGWYKYSVDGGKSYEAAQKLIKEVSVPGAFIVAYRGKSKLDLRTAIRSTKNK
jgi:hypothetical protein